MIDVVSLEKRHPGTDRPTLSELTFSVAKGALVAVLGKSGAGKSTLLRCLSGLDRFDGGRIVVAGVSVEGGAEPSALRGRVGLVFQSLELFPHLTVLDNCTLAPRLRRGLARKDAEARAMVLLEELDIARFAKSHPEGLSGGQRQRVAIARALMVEPEVLLYDEPTSALDPELKAEVGRTLLRVAERTGMTQVVVTHDMSLAREVAREVFVLEAGSIARRGAPADVLA